MPIRKGDGTIIIPNGIGEVRRGDGTIIYTAAAAFETFDDGSLSEYITQNNGSNDTVDLVTSPIKDGSHALKINSEVDSFPGPIVSTTSKNGPEPPVDFGFYIRAAEPGVFGRVNWCVQDESNPEADSYRLLFDFGRETKIALDVNSTSNGDRRLDLFAGFQRLTDEYLWCHVTHDSGTIKAKVYDSDGDYLGEVQGSDSEFSTGGMAFAGTQESIDWVSTTDGPMYFDTWREARSSVSGTTATVTDNLSTWLSFDRDGSNTATDIATKFGDSTRTNGSINGATRSRIGKTGQYSIDFDGSNDFIKVNDDSTITAGGSDWTVGLWYRTQTTPGDVDYLLAKNDSNKGSKFDNSYGIYVNSTPNIVTSFDDGSATGSPFTVIDTDGEWHHVVGRRNGDTFDLFVDGVLVESETNSSVSDLDQPGDLYIGCGYDGGTTGHFKGTIDDVRIYSTALSDSQIQQWYGKTYRTATPFALKSQKVIRNRNDRHEARGTIETLPNGDWIAAYREAADHQATTDHFVHVIFSDDEGVTWTADDTQLDGAQVGGAPFTASQTDASLQNTQVLVADNDDILIHSAGNFTDGTRVGTRQFRSTDNGANWTDEGLINPNGLPVEEFALANDHFVDPDTGDIYVGVFVDPGADRVKPWKSGIAKSTDNGANWDYITDISSTSLNTNEVGLEYLGGDEMFALLRDTDQNTTYGARSTDMGQTWTTPSSIDILGVFQMARLSLRGRIDPNLNRFEGPLYAYGRQHKSTVTDSVALAVSYDGGSSWSQTYHYDRFIDAAYADIQGRSNGDIYMMTYGGRDSDAALRDYVFEHRRE